MISNRQKYFELIKLNNKFLPKNVIYDLLIRVNNFCDANELILKFDDSLKNEETLNNYIKNIISGIPYQYVIHESKFCDLTLYVDNSVLIPRQETEELAILAKETILKIFQGKNDIKIADVCTGSGCIGIALYNFLKDLFNIEMYLSDISKDALNVTYKNVKKYDFDINLLEGNLLEPIIEKTIELDVIISNPPYIPSKDTVSEETLKHEPHLALFASPSYKFYEEIFIQSKKCLSENGILLFEIGEDMEEDLRKLTDKYFPNKRVSFHKDLYTKTRFLFII